MGLAIVIEDEHRRRTRELQDISDVILGLIARASGAGKALHVLHYIDPYGDTILNALQQDAALEDLDILNTIALSDEEASTVALFRALLIESRRQPHQYVRLIGD